jgi:hypothetical protein
MKEIRERFVAAIEELTRTAFGVNFVWDRGVAYFNEVASKAGS